MPRPSVTRSTLHSGPTRAAGLLLALVLAACGGGGNGLELEDVRARTALASAGFGAVYLDITNDTDTDDELVGGTVDESVAGAVELHETRPMGSGSESAGDDMAMTEGGDAMMSGMEGMEMVEVAAIAVPAGETVSLEPGGLHIMLIDLVDDLVDGDEFDLDLEFAEAGTRTVTVTVTVQP
jgi:copper(I)-binding protein